MLRFLQNITKGHRAYLVAITLTGIAEIAFSLAFVWFSKTIIDIATGEKQGDLVYYAVLLVVLMLLQITMHIVDVRLRNMANVRLGNTIRYNVFSHLLYTQWQKLTELHSGDMLTRIIKDTDDIVSVLTTALPITVAAAVQFVGALVMLYILDPMLALILGVAMPILILFSKAYYTRMRRYTLQVKESESAITSLMEESLLNQVVIRTFERQEGELGRLGSLQSQLHERVHKRTNVSVFANAMMGIAFNGGYIVAFLWSAFGLANKTITFGTVTAYLQLVARIQRPLFDFMRMIPNIVSAKAATERLITLTEFEREAEGDKIFLQNNVSLHIDNISFGYDESQPVINNFSLSANPGDMIAIMGETGAGKTTLLRLLLGLVKPCEGTLTIADDSRRVQVSEHTRSNFVYVPQGNSLFSGTIRENLLIGNPNASDEELRHALSIASADFVFNKPEGLDAVLGENGAGLSEGQAQRIAIARSWLRQGKIMLLDEATSALDAKTERLFLRNLRNEIKGKIVLFITHHREIANYCDRVCVV